MGVKALGSLKGHPHSRSGPFREGVRGRRLKCITQRYEYSRRVFIPFSVEPVCN